MSEAAPSIIPRWFWFAASGALIWNLIGVMTYLADVTMSADALAQLPQEQQALRAQMPAFITGAYAIAVFSGALGALFMLMRKSWAVQAFAISLAALLVQFGYLFLAMNAIAQTGAGAAVFPAFIVIVGLLLLRFAMSAKRKGWLR